jgi:signal transduction histidine kinase
MRKISALDWLYLFLAAAAYAAVSLQYPISTRSAAPPQFVQALFWTAVICSAAAVFLQVKAVGAKRYFAALSLQIVAMAVIVPTTSGAPFIALPVFGCITIGLCLYNPFPMNVLASFSFNALVIVIRGLILYRRDGRVESDFWLVAGYGGIAVLVTFFASVMVWYRSLLIDAHKEVERLDLLVDRLTRANLQYQEYAKIVGEASVETERKRITRDIHDIVGYTLTNNITMMEAITDMMNINPLGVAHLVNSARENAQEGLARVREALGVLREAEVPYPTGFAALQRLILVFRKATGVNVEVAFSEIQWEFPLEVETTLYHIVQESLVNSFRHGQASQVRIFLSKTEGSLVLKISDNGLGADVLKEGIGLAGMRERVERLGGALRAGSFLGGFDVTVTVPQQA